MREVCNSPLRFIFCVAWPLMVLWDEVGALQKNNFSNSDFFRTCLDCFQSTQNRYVDRRGDLEHCLPNSSDKRVIHVPFREKKNLYWNILRARPETFAYPVTLSRIIVHFALFQGQLRDEPKKLNIISWCKWSGFGFLKLWLTSTADTPENIASWIILSCLVYFPDQRNKGLPVYLKICG